jgi:hypothetical protein
MMVLGRGCRKHLGPPLFGLACGDAARVFNWLGPSLGVGTVNPPVPRILLFFRGVSTMAGKWLWEIPGIKPWILVFVAGWFWGLSPLSPEDALQILRTSPIMAHGSHKFRLPPFLIMSLPLLFEITTR